MYNDGRGIYRDTKSAGGGGGGGAVRGGLRGLQPPPPPPPVFACAVSPNLFIVFFYLHCLVLNR